MASKPGTETTRHARAGTRSARLGGDGAAAGRKRRSAESDEEQWRRSAERLREKLQPLRDKAADLRAADRGAAGGSPASGPTRDPKSCADQRRLEVLERRIRDAESTFEDRARRQGALPGWIR